MPRRELAALVALSMAVTPVTAAVRGEKAEYVGGTVKQIKQGTQGVLDVDDKTQVRFVYKNNTYAIPYARIRSMEYGTKVGRRVGAAMALGWMMLFSKKTKHYLTLEFSEADGTNGAMVLELAKDTVRPSLATLEARTGKKVEDADKPNFGQNTTPPMNPVLPPSQTMAQTTVAKSSSSSASLSITSTPAGADIELDGKHIGNAPSTVKVQPGSHGITMRKSGYQPWGKTLDVQADASITVAAELVAVKESPSVITIQPRAKQ